MGVLQGVGGLARTAVDAARVFRADATAGQALRHRARQAALGQMEAEFRRPHRTRFDAVIDGLNRMPRPALAFGTLGLFVYAMADPRGFSERMEGLAYVPEPLWWLLGAIVGFYFGARELHYLRAPAEPRPEPVTSSWHHSDEQGGAEAPAASDNPALAEWRAATQP
ncbi:holin family protein [Jannaschia aquimarina]|uniref:Holin of 3TMs, for gene-transfer release n=1 Tax=Jannaschia aquimarina TaxID=935700 RepID=A0A0D1ENP4_9RHOB|nr:hypothetical protein jaqu_10060 [Jannaschia aquimarina]SNT19491.1 Holin of 3TMs, for gene-transfer release [Jannaschia aquimarina]